MKRTILSIKPISQLFPIPMVMGCEGVSAAMLLQYNSHNIKATEIMKHSNILIIPIKAMWVITYLSNCHHQTIFPDAYVPYLQTIDSRIVDGTGTDLTSLETVIDSGQPVIMYHTSLGRKPFRKHFTFDDHEKALVSNIHVTLLIGYDDKYYYYMIPYGVIYLNLLSFLL